MDLYLLVAGFRFFLRFFFPLIIEYGAFHMFLQYLNYFFAKILSGCTVATGSFKVVFTASVMHVAL